MNLVLLLFTSLILRIQTREQKHRQIHHRGSSTYYVLKERHSHTATERTRRKPQIQPIMFNSIPLQTRSSGPYVPQTATMGGMPSVTTDIPICAVLRAFYVGFAATNMTIFQVNRRRRHRFILSGLLFGFCMTRITTLVLRIALATRQHNIRLSIAANILVNAGTLLVYIINLILAQRILRAKQPRVGWHPAMRIGTITQYALIADALGMVIAATVVSAYTLNIDTQRQWRDVQLAAMTYVLVFTCLPLLHIFLAVILPQSPQAESFGQGGVPPKVAIVTISSCLGVLMAGFKVGVNWSPPRPKTDPAWYHSKASFYVFSFALEILILCVLTLSRIDKRFHIPNGSTRPGDYSGARKISEGDHPSVADSMAETVADSIEGGRGQGKKIVIDAGMDWPTHVLLQYTVPLDRSSDRDVQHVTVQHVSV